MGWQEVPYAAALFLGGGIGIFLLGYLYARAEVSWDLTVAWLVALTVGVVVWTAGSAASLVVTGLEAKLFWYRFVWVGTGTVVLSWAAFVLACTGRERWARWPRVLLLAVVPAVGTVAAVTTPAHSLFLADPHVTTESGLAVLEFEYGPLLDALVPALFGMNLAVIALLVRDLLVGAGHRRERFVLLVAGLLPMFGGFYSLVTATLIDYTPILFAVTIPLITWAVVRWHLFDFAAVARERAIGGMEDGVVVVDSKERSAPGSRTQSGDGDDRLVYANATAREAIDLSDVDTLGELRERCTAAAAAFDDPGTVVELETTVEGDPAVFEIRASRVTDDVGAVRGWLLYLDDLTDRRAVERRYGAILERSSALVVILDEDGVVTYASPGHEPVLGYAPEELVGEPIFGLVHPDDRERVQAHFAETVGEGPTRPVEHRLRTDDGRWPTVESVADDLLDDPVIQGVVARAHDITARRQYEQRLSVLHRVLRHNLRNDVNVVRGYASNLAASDDVDVAEPAARIVRRSQELVDLSRKASIAERIDVRRDPLEQDLVALVREVVQAALVRYPHADIGVDCPDAAPVSADALASTAIRNAVDNAVEHNDALRPRVELTVEPVTRDGIDYFELRVTDDGPPIPEVERDSIAAGEESPLSHASGLGLWLVDWIVTQSNGDLSLESTDEGNVVRMTFRRAETG